MEWIELGEVGIITTGNTPRKKVSEYYTSRHIPFIKPTSFQKDRIVDLKISDEFLSKLGKEKGRIATKNDVLVTCIGSVGNVGIARNDICFNQQINSIKPYEDIINYKYLAYSIVFINPVLEHIANKAVVPIINKTNFGKIKIPVPSLTIQEQIVEVLDRAQELIDKRRAQIQAMDSLIESIFYSMFGDPVRNEKGWEVKELGELGRFISGGTPSRKVPEYFEGSIPWITTVALGKFKIGKEDSIELITEEAIYNSATKLIPKKSIMIGTRVGIGKISINSVEMCTNQDIVSITDIKESINLRYIFNTLSLFQVNLQSKSRGATIKGINMKVLKSITIPIPPLDLQNEFAQKVEVIEREKEILEESLELMEENYRSIMDRAFKGELFK